MDDVSGIRSQKATICVHFMDHDTQTHTEDTSTMLPGDDTQDYACCYEN